MLCENDGEEEFKDRNDDSKGDEKGIIFRFVEYWIEGRFTEREWIRKWRRGRRILLVGESDSNLATYKKTIGSDREGQKFIKYTTYFL